MSGFRVPGDFWACTCGKVYRHVCDEAEGCGWQPVNKAPTSLHCGETG